MKLRSRQSSRLGFTMVEIAICIGIIGFALVAIIGVLPTGLGVQKDNREETIVNNDALLLVNALRSGATGAGFDYLTNNFDLIAPNPGPPPASGREIIGLLSRPNGVTTNIIRAFTGELADKGSSATSRELAFKYQLEIDVDPVLVDVSTNGTPRLVANLHQVRMLFRWPVLPNGRVGQGRKVFRATVAGQLTNDTANPNLWFFAPQNFAP